MHKKNKILIIGYGSSATRFIKICQNLGHDIIVYKHRPDLQIAAKYKSTQQLDNLKNNFDQAIISSPTANHYQYLEKIISQKIPVLVDKPITDNLKKALKILKLANQNKTYLQVGFNLRYLKIIDLIKKYLTANKLGKILVIDFYVGQYLPFWRPQKNYAQTYSASYKLGGGVALDLIHEIDLAYFFFDKLKLENIFSDKLSNLKINTEDYVELLQDKNPRIKITLDYLNHSKNRVYKIIGQKASIDCDIINQQLIFIDYKNKTKIIKNKKYFDLQNSYLLEVKNFIKKSNKFKKLTPRDLGIDALEIALKARKHVQKP